MNGRRLPSRRVRVTWEGEGLSARVLGTWPERLRGLLATAPDAEAVLLLGCGSIHTYLMGYGIDVAFLDGRGVALGCFLGLRRGARLRCPGARAVLERPASGGPWPTPGQVLALAWCEGPGERGDRDVWRHDW